MADRDFFIKAGKLECKAMKRQNIIGFSQIKQKKQAIHFLLKHYHCRFFNIFVRGDFDKIPTDG